HHGMQPWSVRSDYTTYKSRFGPKYTTAPNFHGITPRRAIQFGMTAAGFGVAAGIFAVFFFAEVPKMRKDVMQKIPVLGDYFQEEIAPEDNPF
ncbi:hypothetical protein EJ08DRAFT_596329, partial [Tothia fuscella]